LSTDVRVPTIPGIISSVVVNVLLFGMVFLPLVINDGSPLRQFGFRRDCWQQQLADGILGFLASLVPVGLVFGLTAAFRTQESSHALLRLLESDQSMETVFWICVSAVIAAPLVEELVYRVVLQTWLEQRLPPRVALVVAAVIFSAVHRFPDALPLFPLAIVLGYLYQQRRSYLSIVVVHALFNATNLAVLLLSLKRPAESL
jgi:membrane protease YdiL (CAAX protease family)